MLPTDSCPTNPVRQLGQMRFVQFIQSVEATNCSCVRTQPSPEIRAYPSDPSSRCCGLFKQSQKVRSVSVYSVTRCTLLASLSRHGPSIGEKCSTLPPFQWFHSIFAPVPMFTSNSDTCLFLFSVLHLRRRLDSTIVRSLVHHVVACGIHGQWNTNPANLQSCCSTEAETGSVPTSAQFFAESTFMTLRSPS